METTRLVKTNVIKKPDSSEDRFLDHNKKMLNTNEGSDHSILLGPCCITVVVVVIRTVRITKRGPKVPKLSYHH